jgi:hypothetical protein
MEGEQRNLGWRKMARNDARLLRDPLASIGGCGGEQDMNRAVGGVSCMSNRKS